MFQAPSRLARSDRMRERKDTLMKIIIIFSFKTINHIFPFCHPLLYVSRSAQCLSALVIGLDFHSKTQHCQRRERRGEGVHSKKWLSSAFVFSSLILYNQLMFMSLSRESPKNMLNESVGCRCCCSMHACTLHARLNMTSFPGEQALPPSGRRAAARWSHNWSIYCVRRCRSSVYIDL